jgi:hypothetical protein
MPVAYDEGIASKNCAACHGDAYDLLAASKAAHSALDCAFCHQDQHKMVPECTMCHEAPHSAKMLAKFPSCSDCHNIAHDLAF